MRYLVFFLTISSLVSCSNDIYFKQKVEIENASWSYDDPKTYSFEITDTTTYFDIVLEVKHRIDFPYENLYVKIHTLFPDGNKTIDQVSLELADNLDQWQGKCTSNFCTVNILLQSDVYFRKAGKHSLEFEQFNRENPIEGIREMTLNLITLDK